MSKRLAQAVIDGKVSVANKTAGEAILYLTLPNMDKKTILIPPFGSTEIAPKHIPVNHVNRVSNLKSLLAKGVLRVL